jgi:DNA-directed RNA polymerase subunit RPC12/RpoP
MIDSDRDVVFACSSCSRATRSPRTPINVCDCGGRVVLRYADHVDGVGGGAGAADRDGGARGA